MDTDYFFIRSDRKYIRINVDDVIYIEGLKDYVSLKTISEQYPIAMNIKTIYAQLNHEVFLRISRSSIVNVNKIAEIERNNLYLSGADKVLSIGENYRPQLLDFLQSKLIKKDTKNLNLLEE
jgi:two-component system, LytTR family, response regulator